MTILRRIVLLLGLAGVFWLSPAYGLDIGINFQLGFATDVRPGAKDASQALGLVVMPGDVITDSKHRLTFTGTIVNMSGLPRDNVSMSVAVTSYIGTGASFGLADIRPRSIPPGGSASFTTYISLDDERPRTVLYTVSGQGVRAAAPAYATPMPMAVPQSIPQTIRDASGTVYYLDPASGYYYPAEP